MNDFLSTVLGPWLEYELEEKQHSLLYWNKNIGGYTTKYGGFYTQDQLARQAQALISNKYASEVSSNVMLLLAGVSTPAQFKERFAQSLKDTWTMAAMLGRGGPDQMTPADYGRIGGHLKFEYSRLEDFVQKIVAGEYTDKQIRWRAGLYDQGPMVSFYDGERAAKIEAGFTLEQRILNPAEHCPDCVNYAARGAVPIGTLPVPGMGSRCLHNCKCKLVYLTDAGLNIENIMAAGRFGEEIIEGMPSSGDLEGGEWSSDEYVDFAVDWYDPDGEGNIGSYSGVGDFDSDEAGRQKDEVVTELVRRTGLPYHEVNEFIAQWAKMSNDDDYRALSIQEIAGELFGNGVSYWQQDKIDDFKRIRERAAQSGYYLGDSSKMHFEGPNVGSTTPGAREAGYSTPGEAIRACLVAMYKITQASFQAAGIKELVLYRGIKLEPDIDDDNYEGDEFILDDGNALESWTISETMAQRFADDYMVDESTWNGYVIGIRVPVERVIGSARTGFGCLKEWEVVVLGGGDNDEGIVVVKNEGEPDGFEDQDGYFWEGYTEDDGEYDSQGIWKPEGLDYLIHDPDGNSYWAEDAPQADVETAGFDYYGDWGDPDEDTGHQDQDGDWVWQPAPPTDPQAQFATGPDQAGYDFYNVWGDPNDEDEGYYDEDGHWVWSKGVPAQKDQLTLPGILD